eukprot:PhF_6_TR35000/c0_g1_i1/m.50897
MFTITMDRESLLTTFNLLPRLYPRSIFPTPTLLSIIEFMKNPNYSNTWSFIDVGPAVVVTYIAAQSLHDAMRVLRLEMFTPPSTKSVVTAYLWKRDEIGFGLGHLAALCGNVHVLRQQWVLDLAEADEEPLDFGNGSPITFLLLSPEADIRSYATKLVMKRKSPLQYESRVLLFQCMGGNVLSTFGFNQIHDIDTVFEIQNQFKFSESTFNLVCSGGFSDVFQSFVKRKGNDLFVLQEALTLIGDKQIPINNAVVNDHIDFERECVIPLIQRVVRACAGDITGYNKIVEGIQQHLCCITRQEKHYYVEVIKQFCEFLPSAIISLNPDILSDAIRSGSMDMVNVLLPYYDINTAATKRGNALLDAIHFGHMRMVEYFHQLSPTLLFNFENSKQNTAVHEGAGVSVAMLTWVLERMGERDFKRCLILRRTALDTNTPWFVAIEAGKVDCVQYLGNTFGDLVLDQVSVDTGMLKTTKTGAHVAAFSYSANWQSVLF